MNTSSPLWKKRLVLSALAAILPLSAVADGRHSASSLHGRCDGPPPVGNVAMYPHHEMGRPGMHPGMMPHLPFLHRIELSEAQQDKVFELMTANLPAERAKAKLARKAMDDLRKLGAADMRMDVAVLVFVFKIEVRPPIVNDDPAPFKKRKLL